MPAAGGRDINKLAGLSAEGRSSATTLLVSSALRWMNRNDTTLKPEVARLQLQAQMANFVSGLHVDRLTMAYR